LIVFGRGYYDFNKHSIRIEYGYYFLKTGRVGCWKSSIPPFLRCSDGLLTAV